MEGSNAPKRHFTLKHGGMDVKSEKAGAAGMNPGSALVLYTPDEACLVQTGPIRAI
jgi:hypothetical protein